MPRRHLTVEVLPELTARLDGGESRESVLAEVEVGWPQFVAIQERWLIGLAREALSGEVGNLERVAAEYRKFRAKDWAPSPPAPPSPIRPAFGGTMVASEEMLARSMEPRHPVDPTLASAVSEPILATPMPRQVVSPASPAQVNAAAQPAVGRRAPARTAFDNSGFALMDEAQMRAPVSIVSPEVREPIASPNPPPRAVSPSPVPPAPVSPPFAVPQVPAPRAAAPLPIVSHAREAAPEPIAPPFAAPPPPAAFAEPALVPGHRNALGTLPPTPVRPAPREAQATPNPAAQRPPEQPGYGRPQNPAPGAPVSPSPFAAPAPAAPSPAPVPYAAPLPPGPAYPAPLPAGPAYPAPLPAAPAYPAPLPAAPAPVAYAAAAYSQPDPAAPFGAPGGAMNGQQAYPGPSNAAPPVLKPLTPSWELAGPGGGLAPNWGQPASPVAARPAPAPFGAPPANPSPYGQEVQPKPMAGPSFRGAAAQPGPAPMPTQARAALSLEQMACIQAELDLDPNRAGATFAQNGIDSAEYQRQMSALQTTLGSDAHKAERFEQLRQYYRAVLGPRR